jgi:hypothetical protein
MPAPPANRWRVPVVSALLLAGLAGAIGYAMWVSLAPPSGPQAVGDIKVALATNPTPARLGRNLLQIQLVGPGEKPVTDADLEVRYGMEMDSLRLRAPAGHTGGGLYESPVDFPAPGPWQVTVRVRRPRASDLESNYLFNVAAAPGGVPMAGSAPMGAPPESGKPTAGGTGAIAGTIRIAPGLAKEVVPTDVLFIIARKGEAGPPLAVRRIEGPKFPLAYRLSAENVMIQGMPFEGQVNLVARLKKDGVPGPPRPGDLEGVYVKNPATVGATGVDILVDKKY